MTRKNDAMPKDKILIIENDDDLFACVYSVLYGNFSEIKRARCAVEADRSLHAVNFKFVLSNINLPDQSAWLMVKKWRLGGIHVPIWIYSSNDSNSVQEWTNFLNVDGVISYKGNRIVLASKIHHIFAQKTSLDHGPIASLKRWVAAAVLSLLLFASGCASGRNKNDLTDFQPSPVNPFASPKVSSIPAAADTTANAEQRIQNTQAPNSSFAGNPYLNTGTTPTQTYNNISQQTPSPETQYGGQKRCPVTGEVLGLSRPAVPVQWNGKVIYVVNEESAQKFIANPSLYGSLVEAEQNPGRFTPVGGGFTLSETKKSCGSGQCNH